MGWGAWHPRGSTSGHSDSPGSPGLGSWGVGSTLPQATGEPFKVHKGAGHLRGCRRRCRKRSNSGQRPGRQECCPVRGECHGGVGLPGWAGLSCPSPNSLLGFIRVPYHLPQSPKPRGAVGTVSPVPPDGFLNSLPLRASCRHFWVQTGTRVTGRAWAAASVAADSAHGAGQVAGSPRDSWTGPLRRWLWVGGPCRGQRCPSSCPQETQKRGRFPSQGLLSLVGLSWCVYWLLSQNWDGNSD